VGRWAKFFELLAGEDINGDKMNLGVTVLTSLRGRHIDDLTWAVLDADEAILPQGRALHGVGSRGTGIGALKGVFMFYDTLLAIRMYLHNFLDLKKSGVVNM